MGGGGGGGEAHKQNKKQKQKQKPPTFWKAVALTSTERSNIEIENVLKYFLHYSAWKTSPWK